MTKRYPHYQLSYATITLWNNWSHRYLMDFASYFTYPCRLYNTGLASLLLKSKMKCQHGCGVPSSQKYSSGTWWNKVSFVVTNWVSLPTSNWGLVITCVLNADFNDFPLFPREICAVDFQKKLPLVTKSFHTIHYILWPKQGQRM